MELEFTNLLIVAAVAFSAPLVLGLAPALRVPAVVLEIVVGILIGPQVLGWVEIDEPVRVLSILGLAVLLFLAGLEIDYERLRGRVARLAGLGFAASFAIAIACGLLLKLTGTVNDGLFIPVFFVATGIAYDLDALGELSTLVEVPIFLAALLAVRALPALLYRRVIKGRQVVVAGLLQATSLPFIVAATAIGIELGTIEAGTAAAFIAAGLVSVVAFPTLALVLLGRAGRGSAPGTASA